MKFLIVGYQHRTGNSKKTGNPYNFIEVHAVGSPAYPSHNGFASTTFICNPDAFKPSGLPCIADVTFTQTGSVDTMNVFKEPLGVNAANRFFGG